MEGDPEGVSISLVMGCRYSSRSPRRSARHPWLGWVRARVSEEIVLGWFLESVFDYLDFAVWVIDLG